jgi:hypothetical protein
VGIVIVLAEPHEKALPLRVPPGHPKKSPPNTGFCKDVFQDVMGFWKADGSLLNLRTVVRHHFAA